MPIMRKILAAAAVSLTLAGVAAAGPLSADAATLRCGPRCVDLFSRLSGTHRHPGFVLDVLGSRAAVGQPVILAPASWTLTGEDFTIFREAAVSEFFADGLLSAAVNLHYGGLLPGGPDDTAYEFEYSPAGRGSGLCAGLPGLLAAATQVSLQRCDVTSRTVWIADSSQPIGASYLPLISGSTTNFSHPFVLTDPGRPFWLGPPLTAQNLTVPVGIFGVPTGTVEPGQLWGADFGVLLPRGS